MPVGRAAPPGSPGRARSSAPSISEAVAKRSSGTLRTAFSMIAPTGESTTEGGKGKGASADHGTADRATAERME